MEQKPQENTAPRKNHLRIPWVQSVFIIVIVFGALIGFLIWLSVRHTVFIENAYLEAPVADISPAVSGILSAVYVKDGDSVSPSSPVALVGGQTLYAQNGGIVVSAPEVLGSYFSPGQTVVSVVDETQMKAVGQVEETKGLKDIAAGERATFSVDAYPGRTYEGIVDEVSPVSEDESAVFSISDERPVRKFDVSVRFDESKYPELKSGMSAKITVFVK